MTKINLAYRNAKGHMKSVDPNNVPDDAPSDVKLYAEMLRNAQDAKQVGAFNVADDVPEAVKMVADEMQGVLHMHPEEIALVAAAMREAMREVLTSREVPKVNEDGTPKRGRGRPKGYQCSAETIAKMAESRRRTWENRKRQMIGEAWEDAAAAQMETEAAEEAFQMADGA